MHCFNGIQSIIILKRLPNIELGMLLAAVRVSEYLNQSTKVIIFYLLIILLSNERNNITKSVDGRLYKEVTTLFKLGKF